MLKRAAFVVLGLAVLSAAGMPLRLPCCSLRKLESTGIQSDCCPIPGCTLAEKAGPAAAALREAGALEVPSLAVARVADAPVVVLAAPFVGVPATAASPPRGRPSLSLLSIYRI